MSKVSITRSLLDDLAVSISTKSGEPVPMTLTEMKDAVDGISSTTVEALSVTSNGTYTAPTGKAYTPVTVNVSAPSPSLQSKTVSYTPTESAQTETVSADSGYDGLSQVSVSVGAISNTYVGTGITRRSSSDLTASGATVTVPSGYYSAQSSKAVASGTAGTPTATKGTVNNHSISVTPSVTNTTGYITGSTKTGTAVTVTAAELVSGSETKTENGTYDVTNLSELVVNVSGGGSVTWETVYDGNVTIVADSPNYVVINNWVPTHPIFADGQTWRITWNGTEYVCPVKVQQGTIYIGNAQLVGYSDTSNEPFFGYMRTSTQLAFVTTDSAGSITLKMELQHDTSATLIEKTITANGTYDAEDDDADGYSSVTVNVPTGTPTIQSLTVNPSTTQQTFNASGVDGYKPVTVAAVSQTNLTADNIKNGTTVTISNGTSNIYSVTGTYSGSGSSKNTQVVQSTTRTNASTLTAIGAELTVSKTGTYDIYYSCFRTNTSASYTWATRLYINGTAYGTAENATWTNNQQNTHLSNISLTTNDKLRVYGRNTRGTSYYICAPMLAIVEA